MRDNNKLLHIEAKSFPKFKSAPIQSTSSQGRQASEKEIISSSTNPSNTQKVSLFFVNRHGDSNIVAFDFKLNKNELPQYKHSNPNVVRPLGLSGTSIRLMSTGEFEIGETSIREDSSRYFQTLKKDDKLKHSKITSNVVEFDYSANIVTFMNGIDDEFEVIITDTDKRIGQLYQELQKEPSLIDSWLEFISLQGYLPNVSQAAKVERQIAIIESALKHNPNSERLVMKYLDLQAKLKSSEAILELWKLVISRFKHSWSLRFAYIEFFTSHCFTHYSVDRCIQMHFDLAKDFKHAQLESSPETVALACNLIHILISSGRSEKALSLLYYLILSYSRKTITIGEFQQFWIRKRIELFSTSYHDSEEEDLLTKELKDELCWNAIDKEGSSMEMENCFAKSDLSLASHNLISHVIYCFLDVIGICLGRIDKISAFQLCPLSLTYADTIALQSPCSQAWTTSDAPEYSVKANFSKSDYEILPARSIIMILNELRVHLYVIWNEICPRIAQLMDQAGHDGLNYLRKSLAEEPDSIGLYHHYVMFLRWKNRDIEAQKVLEKLLKAKVEDTYRLHRFQWCQCLCEILIRQNRRQEALLMIYHVLSIDPLTISTVSFLKAKKILNNDETQPQILALAKLLDYLGNNSMAQSKPIPKEHKIERTPVGIESILCSTPLKERSELVKKISIEENTSGTITEYLKILSSRTTNEAKLGIFSLLQIAPYSKRMIFLYLYALIVIVLALSAMKYLKTIHLITDLEIEEICMVLEEKGCQFYLLL